MADTMLSIDLFELGKTCLASFIREFETYGIAADPNLELRRGTGMLCYYDFKDRQIYFSLPDLNQPEGKLHLLMLRSLLAAENNEDLLRFLRMFIPQIIAHELAHHFRHRYGLLTNDMWREEQIANQLAVAVTKHRLTPEDREYARAFLRRAIDTLSAKMAEKHIATDSYYSVLYALNASGEIPDDEVNQIELIQRLFSLDPEQILKGSGQLSDELIQRLEQRDDIINSINEKYASDYMQYMAYHVQWLYLALTSRESHYVEEFARIHLNRRVELLPPLDPNTVSSDEAIQACYLAYQHTLPLSETGARYFYKRYRSLLLTRLQAAELRIPSQTESLRKEARLLLESWSGDDADALIYLADLAPPELRTLFPHTIAGHIDPKLAVQLHLPQETDRRLWRRIVLGEQDAAAANTLYRLSLLDQTDIYRPLPAEVLLQLTQNLCRIKLAPGETIIWESQLNDDVFILIEGSLEVFVTQDGQLKRVGTIREGEVFGEMAFFTREARKATVRASVPSECFVLKDSDLKLYAFQHPSILMQMAGVLARRLASLNLQRS
ncbi:MAG: hypothetical protein KatS3mg057_3040 [Herpetosiphonaceae bacterium]|nr:MAG: hypothetical protein KatS3mg057_3040 [Herpetosiphonaceae bacterium]